jgi:hypothetical protein
MDCALSFQVQDCRFMVDCLNFYYIESNTSQEREEAVSINKDQVTSAKKRLDSEQRGLLSRKISDLALKINGTRLEHLINELYAEMANAGIAFRPKTYLSDEWGCPQGIPVIGIPFYLADPRLFELEGVLTGIEAESDGEVMMSLRHEAGHAFNYGYLLYLKAEWGRLFGTFSRSYKEEYRPVPFSARFVHHIPGWYAQKHPDDDFAETFAVWLTPGFDWKSSYRGTPALAKLNYVSRLVNRYGREPLVVKDEKLDRPVQELKITLDNWYEASRNLGRSRIRLHHIIDDDLSKLFADREGQPAGDLLLAGRGTLTRGVNHWTGIDRHILDSLFNELMERVRLLDLKVAADQKEMRMLNAGIFLATLALNYTTSGRFIEV